MKSNSYYAKYRVEILLKMNFILTERRNASQFSLSFMLTELQRTEAFSFVATVYVYWISYHFACRFFSKTLFAAVFLLLHSND